MKNVSIRSSDHGWNVTVVLNVQHPDQCLLWRFIIYSKKIFSKYIDDVLKVFSALPFTNPQKSSTVFVEIKFYHFFFSMKKTYNKPLELRYFEVKFSNF